MLTKQDYLEHIPKSCQIDRDKLSSIYADIFPNPVEFIEVGAFDGYTYSNTYCLSKLGWRGVYVEPIKEFADKCRFNHRGLSIEVVEAAVSNFKGNTYIYTNGDTSSIKLSPVSKAWGCKEERKTQVITVTLNCLLEEKGFKPSFGVICIDAEDSEPEILSCFDIHKWRPVVAIMETHELYKNELYLENGKNTKLELIDSCFLSVGYKKLYADEINTIYHKV